MNETEIRQVEDLVSFRLPESFRAFLGKMGRKAGKWEHFILSLNSGEVNLEDLAGFIKYDRKVIPERTLTDGARLPDNIMFIDCLGWEFRFFVSLDQGGDPPVLVYVEGETTFRKKYDSLINLLESRRDWCLKSQREAGDVNQVAEHQKDMIETGGYSPDKLRTMDFEDDEDGYDLKKAAEAWLAEIEADEEN